MLPNYPGCIGQFTTMQLRVFILSLLVCSTATLAGQAGTSGPLVIQPGDTLRLPAEAHGSLDSLEIYGTLLIDAPLRPDTPLRHILVKPGGSAQLSSPAAPLKLSCSITIERGAGAVELHGLQLQKPTNAPYALAAYGGELTCTNSNIRGQGDLVLLDGAEGAVLRNNTLYTEAGSALRVAPAGLGSDNDISGNDIEVVSHDRATVAVFFGNPLQRFLGNEVRLQGYGVAVDYSPPTAYNSYTWPAAELQFSNNQLLATTPGLGVGLRVAYHKLPGYAVTKGNLIAGFAIGAELDCPFFIARDWTLRDNGTGIHLSRGKLEESKIVAPQAAARAGVVAPGGRSATNLQLRDLMIHGYPTGVVVPDHLSERSSISGLQLHGVDLPLELPASAEGSLFFPQGASFLSGSPASQEHHGHHAGHGEAMDGHHQKAESASEETPLGMAHNHAAPPSPALHLLPSQHRAVSPACTDHAGWKVCPVQAVGELTISTGFGMSDPIHEHDRPLLDPVLIRQGQTRTLPSDHQTATTLIAADQLYELAIPELENIFDISLSWACEGDGLARLRLRYPHKSPQVFTALGYQLTRFTKLDEWSAATEPGWYFDEAAGAVYVGIKAVDGTAEVIVYNQSAVTELYDKGLAVPVTTTYVTAGEVTLTFQTQPGRATRVVLTDIFGMPYAELPAVADTQGKTEVTYRDTAGQAQPGWYFLYIGDRYFKGPIAYPAPQLSPKPEHHHH